MPLSEEELRLLEQMERALAEEDPKFAHTLRGTSFQRASRRRALLAVLAFLVGVAILMGGAVAKLIPVGIIGFLVMLAAAVWGLTANRAKPEAAAPKAARGGFSIIDGGRAAKAPRGAGSTPFIERLEERWRRRRGDSGF